MVASTVLVVIAAASNVLCLWLWKHRSALNIVAAVLMIPTVLLLGVFVLAGGLSAVGLVDGGASVIPESSPDMSFAAVESSSRDGQVLVLSLKVDPEGARKIGRPLESVKYPVASVRVDQSTAIILGDERGVIDDVLAGKHIDVWFSGPVAESDPVQATAGTVVINAE